MLTLIGALLIVSGAACIIFDLGMKAAEQKPEQETAKDEENG